MQTPKTDSIIMLVVNTGGSHSKALAPCRHVLIWLQDVPLFHSRPQQGSIGIRNPVQRAKHFPAKLLAGSINWALVAVWWHQMLRNLPSTSPRIYRQVLKECADRTKDELANSSMFWSGNEGWPLSRRVLRTNPEKARVWLLKRKFAKNMDSVKLARQPSPKIAIWTVIYQRSTRSSLWLFAGGNSPKKVLSGDPSISTPTSIASPRTET